MSLKYFQGRTVTGQVEASPATCFRDVVERFRIPPRLSITRSAFLALDKKRRNEIKQVPFFVPATFRQSPSKRDTPNAEDCNLIFLDVDETEDGQCPAAPFVRNPLSLHEALEGFNFLAHTTASSTPEKPRMRIMVDASHIPIAEYPGAVETIWARLGLPTGGRSGAVESRKAVQPMFLPTIFQDSTEAEHPLITHHLDGRAFGVEDIEEHEPRGNNGLNGHKLNGHNGSDPRGNHQPQHEASDALFFLRAPVPEITLAVATEALEHVDPDSPYYEWLECAQALRHQFSPHQAEAAYSLFDQWSAKGAKFTNSTDTRAKWDSIRPTPVGRMPVTIRTLLKLAKGGGWNDQKVKDQSFHAVLSWMGTVPNVTTLMEEGVQKVIAAPQLSATQEGMLVDQLRLQAKERFNFKVLATDIRADIKRIKAEMRAQSRSAEKTKEPTWARNVLYIASTQEFYRHHTGERHKGEAFNALYARHLLPTEDQLKDLGIPATPGNLARPLVSPADYALNHLKIPTVYDYDYDPGQPAEVWFVHEKCKYVNTYSPTYPELDHAHAAEAGERLLRHISHLVLEPEYRRILMDFLAFQVQHPGRKVRWAPLIQGVEGCGKTFIAEMMKVVLGKRHVKTINGATVMGGWNEWAFGYQMVVLEEVRVAGTNRHDIMNRLKEWVTNDGIPITEKFRGSRDIRNITNYILFSNHHDALALAPGDRRYFVIKSAMQMKSQVKALGDDYFPQLFGMLREMPGALRAYLDGWEISPGFRPDGHAPRTKYADEMVEDSASDLHAAVKRLLREADSPLIQWDIVTTQALSNALLMESGLRHFSMQQLSAVLREEGFAQAGRHLFGDERHYVWARHGVCLATAHEVALERFKSGAKNLGMEML